MKGLRIDGLVAGYGDLTVLRGVSFAVEPGQLLVLAGPNGAGKTTLLSAVIGRLSTAKGSILLDGAELVGLPIHRRTRLGIGLVPEGRGLFPGLTVWENLRVAARAARLSGAESREGIQRAVDAFPVIGERLKQKVRSLSGGEQQMLAIGRSLLTNPRVLLLDEPSMGLAPIVWREVLQTCRRLADEGRVVVVVEQRVLEALAAADRCVVMQQGRVVRDGTAETGSAALPELAATYFSAGATA